MNRTERQTRLKDEEDAAVEKKAGACQSQSYGNNVVARIVSKGHNANGNTSGDKHSHRQIESYHRTLQNAGPACPFVELLEDHSLPLHCICSLLFIIAHRLPLIRQSAHPIYPPSQP